MFKPAARLVTGLAVVALFGCQPPAIPGLIGLAPKVLALTTQDAVTGVVKHRVALDWADALNARQYEVIRKFGDKSSIFTTQESHYVDDTVGAGQTFTYSIRALSGTNEELTASDPKSVTVLAKEVAAPTLSEPANNATVAIGEVPTFSWQAAQNANWYYITVRDGRTNDLTWSALTQDTSIKYASESPLKLDELTDQFPVGKKADITKGIVYQWQVQSLRGDAGVLKEVKGLDVTPSEQRQFSQGG